MKRFLILVTAVELLLPASQIHSQSVDCFEDQGVFGLLPGASESHIAPHDGFADGVVYLNGGFAGSIGDYYVLRNGENLFSVYLPNKAKLVVEVQYANKSDEECGHTVLSNVSVRDLEPCASPDDVPLKIQSIADYSLRTSPNVGVVIGRPKFVKRAQPNCGSLPSSLGNIIYSNLRLTVNSNVERAEIVVENFGGDPISVGEVDMNAPLSIPFPTNLSEISIVIKKEGYANCNLLLNTRLEEHVGDCNLIKLYTSH